jgi:hypothetical protein
MGDILWGCANGKPDLEFDGGFDFEQLGISDHQKPVKV